MEQIQRLGAERPLYRTACDLIRRGSRRSKRIAITKCKESCPGLRRKTRHTVRKKDEVNCSSDRRSAMEPVHSSRQRRYVHLSPSYLQAGSCQSITRAE